MRAALLSAVFLALAPAAVAAPATRSAAQREYLDLVAAEQVPVGWTGSVDGCQVGEESPASIAATLKALNILRDFAGLAPVRFDAELNRKALAAALMMRAAGDLSHDPGPEWPCYTADGDEGAGRSNLALGVSGARAMAGYVEDGGVGSLGHRRWVLDPGGTVFGTGSTDSTNALLVIGGGASTAPPPQLVGWPPAGHFPWPLVFGTWSAAITGDADLSTASVGVTVGGQPRAVSNLSDLGEGFGTGQTLSWNVALDEADRHADVPIVVTITGATPQPLSYTVNAFRSRIRAELAAKAKRTKRRLKVRATITPQANGDKLTLTTRGKTYTRTIRKGAARFNVPRGKAKLRYAGSDTVLPATLTLRR